MAASQTERLAQGEYGSKKVQAIVSVAEVNPTSQQGSMAEVCQILTHALQQASAPLFDYPVGAKHQPGRDLMTDLFRNLEIYHQLEFGWLFYREISGLRAAENFGELPGQLPI